MSSLAIDCNKISSKAIHADAHLSDVADIAPPIRMSTCFEYPQGIEPEDMTAKEAKGVVYQRELHPNCLRAEAALSSIIGQPTLLFGSGLSAFHNAMITINPKTIFTAHPSYHGVHAILEILKRNYNVNIVDINSDPSLLQKGDVVHLESPVNPAGTARNIQHYADIAHSRGAYLVIDSTFAPPPLSDPFKHGADVVMHSATKYFGGHSDLLAGSLSFKDPELAKKVDLDRGVVGTIISPWESWMLLRSLKTYALRIERQCSNANKIVEYLEAHKSELPLLESVSHSSLQTEPWVKEQLPYGGSPTFLFMCKSVEAAKAVPSKVSMYHHCTSLGGVESMLEWRLLSDSTCSPKAIRVSVGAENVDDLIDDLVKALK